MPEALSLITSFDPWRSKLCTCPPKLTFNPYTGCDHRCLYCYASSYIPKFYDCRPKKDLLTRLEREAQKLRGEIVSIANSSDPYPTIEAEKTLTRRCLKILAGYNCKIQIITKSDLVMRDIDLLAKIPTVVALTITTEDEDLAKVLEPNAPSPKQRLKAIQTLIDKGIPVTVRVDPVIPYVNDNPENLIKTLAAIDVKHITASTYKVKADNWQRLSLAMPETAQKLKPLYFEKGEKIARYTYLPKGLRIKLMEKVAASAKKHGLKFGTCREGLSHLNTATCDGTWLLKKA
ncbi:MAG: radical SAM protein [Candidatus Bathyarchaeia archaeon]